VFHAHSAPQGPYAAAPSATLICFSHLRWDFVFQRPQHLMTRMMAFGQVIFWEEPVYRHDLSSAELALRQCPASGVQIAVPQVPAGMSGEALNCALKELLEPLAGNGTRILWYYTPMMLDFSAHLSADCVVYDCMDELANFRFAPPELVENERRLLERADLVFTGGYSLYEAKRGRHPHVHPFPSSVDSAHFAAARECGEEPLDQRDLPYPRIGYCGVIDERLDLDLVAALAAARPGWSVVMVGPVVKIGQADLPRAPNIHYLGAKAYHDLPAYMRGWDVALMPFALNEATRFISPTKTPEYLSAGLPVVSTGIADVIRTYAGLEAVAIVNDPATALAACDAALARAGDTRWRDEADRLLAAMSWDRTFAAMRSLFVQAMANRSTAPVPRRSDVRTQRRHYDVLVVGAGFAGSVMAERMASDAGLKVKVIDRRPHVGGNAHDLRNDAGHLIHQYGPHIFHTNSATIFDYLSRFTGWRPYEHRVLAAVDGKTVPIPINRTTLNDVFGLNLRSEEEARAFLAARAEAVEEIRSSEDVVVSSVGRELYEMFFRGYTRKQWGMDPSELDRAVTARVPTRTNTDDRYFTDRYQAMPVQGYTQMFERMLDHSGIDVQTGMEWEEARQTFTWDRLVFTGPIDEYFGYDLGHLPYRSLRFEHETLDAEWLQPVAVVNYPDQAVPYTRITEYKHLTGDRSDRTSITREYPSDTGDPYYPIPRADCQALYRRYQERSAMEPATTFVGRLATYQYYNMDQVVGQALATYRRHFAPERAPATTAPAALSNQIHPLAVGAR